ncbi:hypothetical protein QCA50_007690 [Cerrena zonata]|uniref:Rad1-domain-containing protein n=1 Tax=Cerrena zonata TaxID=2478898 RepID=A0AAW0GCE0_9APHY
MSQSQVASDESPQYVLSVFNNDLRHFTNLLRGIGFQKRALFDITEGGMVVTVEESRTLLAFAFIRHDMFDEFIYDADLAAELDPDPQNDDEPILPKRTIFEVNLQMMIDCLNVFGTASASASSASTKKLKYAGWDKPDDERQGEGSGLRGRGGANASRNGRIDQYMGNGTGTALKMTYGGRGQPLVLHLMEDMNGPNAVCELTTYEPEPALDLPFDSEAMVMKMILKSSWLQEALTELHPSCEKMTIIGNPPPPPGRGPTLTAPPRLRLKATGTFGTTEMDYPNDKEVLESCECDTHVSFTYRTSHIARVTRALPHSSKTSVRIDEEGLLSLQLIIPSPKKKGTKTMDAFTEFRCLPIED